MLPVTTDSLSLYMYQIKQFPLLTLEEEIDLANRYIQTQDINAAYKLVTSHLRYAAKIAFTYRGYGLPMMDIISEANIGLMKALKRYNPTIGRFVTYSRLWIKAQIHEFLLSNISMIKICSNKSRSKLLKGLHNLNRQLHYCQNIEQTYTTVANDINVTVDELKEFQLRFLPSISLNCPQDENSSAATLQDRIVDETPLVEEVLIEQQETTNVNRKLYDAFSKLDERKQYIVKNRFLTDKQESLESIAQKFNVSRERIRQLETIALNEMKRYMEGQ
jgi:RNA polymerase sigma-32 factor